MLAPSSPRKRWRRCGNRWHLEFVSSYWNTRFPGQIPDRLVAAEPLIGDRLELEGNDLVVVALGHTDTDDRHHLSAGAFPRPGGGR
ncbi:hypothetical protein [Streptomyces sp. NPDC052036]|uniref:hypothetical protein n=1 Tax=Streptomyces sp. NPDC052036 TaxID=3155171 RepID=UPI00341892CF